MVKVFKENANGKIELTLEELEELLKQAEEEGRMSAFRSAPAPSITYPPCPYTLPSTIPPNIIYCGDSQPFWNKTTTAASTDGNTATIHASNQAFCTPAEGTESAR